MKTILLTALAFTATVVSATAQTIADPPSVFGRFDGQTYIFSPTYALANGANIDTTTINCDTTGLVVFHQPKFYLGHQWGTASRSVNKRLHHNFNNENLYYSKIRHTVFGAADTSQPYFVSWKMGDFFGYYGAMQFDPDAPLMDAKGVFLPRTGDTTGAVFGFSYKDTVAGRLTNNPSDANFKRYRLFKDSVSAPRVVLKGAAAEAMKGLVSYETTAPPGSADWEREMNDNGQRWYLAVNLRRTNVADSIADTAVVLSLRVKYKTFPNPSNIVITDSIRFDSVSAVRAGGVYDTVRTDRGLMDAKLSDSAQTPGFDRQTLFIRRNMLPRRADTDSNDITISAFFRANGDTTANPRLRGYTATGSDRIDSLDIEVTYHGKADVAIDWLRLETPRARRLLRGELDREFAARLSVLMDTLRYWRDTKGFGKLRLAKIYLNDEPGGRPAEWRAFRYQSRFLDRLATTEGAFDNRYCHAVPQRDYWGSVPQVVASDKAPYVPYVMHHTVNNDAADSVYRYHIYPKTMRDLGYKGGVRPHNFASDALRAANSELVFDSLCSPDDGSGYEKYTFLGGAYVRQCNPARPTPYVASTAGVTGFADSIGGIMKGSRSMLSNLDTGYLATLAAMPEVLFSATPWYSNFWLMSQFRGRYVAGEGIRYAYALYLRPRTGEEVRRTVWSALALGAKGLMYDRWMQHPALVDTATPSSDAGRYALMRGTGQDLFVGVTGGPDSVADGNIDPALSGRDPDSLLRGDEVGGDFVQRRDHTRLDQYINIDSVEYGLGVSRNRIYLGRKSMRLELRKIHDWIAEVGDTLLNMQLVGWWGKGYRPWKFAANNDTAKFVNSYISTEPSRFASRATLRPSAAEGWDSTFYDVGTFRRKDGSKPMTDEFYVSVVNRRTSPLIRNAHTADTLRFYTTHEFDSLTLNEYNNLPDSTRDFWAGQRFCQTGSRKVTLPFNYKDSNGRYALLRVRELGAGNAYLDSVYPYRLDNQLYDMVDTVVGQDKSITFKLLPGEGKIFRVEVLRSNEVAGDLSHSNQTKLVGHALMRRENGAGKWVEGDSMVYYMTYHRRISDLDRRSAVYFRAAKPTSRWDNNAALQWGEEYLLSDETYHHGRWNTADTCGYPSVVVRFDSASQEYHAYVVFGCATPYNPGGGALPDSQIIMETLVRLHADTLMEVLPSLYLANIAGRTLSEWGTPMVNASDTANFYCYADKIQGIIAGWKPPDLSRDLYSTARISWGDTAYCTVTAQHPSLNPYSPYIRGEGHSDAALVWQEKDDCDMTRTQVHYTRLLITGGQIFHDLPPRMISTPFYANADTSIWCVSCDSLPVSQEQHFFPVVYRDLFYPDTSAYYCDWQGLFPGHTRHDLRTDNIGWHTTGETGYPSIPYSLISRRIAYSIDDTSGGGFVPDSLNAFPSETIWSAAYASLSGVNIAAGEAAYSDFPPMYGNTGGCLNYSDRSVALDFGYIPALQPFGQPLWSVIYSTGLPTWAVLASIPLSEAAAGNSPHTAHLAARGTVTLHDWQRGRHIYNADTSEIPPIRTSGRQFYKRANNGNPITETLWGFGSGDGRYVVGAVQFQGRDYPFQPKRALAPSLFEPPDTLVTAWFTVENRARLRLTSAGDAPENVELWLGRRSDGSRWLVPLEAGARRRLARLFVQLENGAGEEYRLEILNATGGSFRREIVLDADADGLGRSAEEDDWRINLGSSDVAQTLTMYPNPAGDEVLIALRGEGAATVEVVNMFGEIVWKTGSISGGVLTVLTSDFAAGVYAVRVARAGLPAAAGRFVVAR